MAQHDYKIAGNVTVIDQKQIESLNAQNITDILKEQLAIHAYDTSIAKTTKIDIRGFGDTAVSNVLVLVDDQKINSIDISGPDFLQIPIESVERIEILRGAGSVLYGDNAVGGVVNIITKKGKGNLKGKVGATYGSYDSLREDLEVSGQKNNLGYYLYSQYYNTGGYRQNSEYLSKDFNARVDHFPWDKLKTNLKIGWHEDDYRLPGGLNDTTELAQLGRRGSANPDDYASTKDRYIKLPFDIRPWPEDIEWSHFIIDTSYKNRDTYAWFDYGASGATATKYNIDTLSLNGKYIFDRQLFNRDFNVVTGIDYDTATNSILGSGKGLSQSFDDLAIFKEGFGIYLYSEYEIFEKLYFNTGTRFQKAFYTFDQHNLPNDIQKEPGVSVSMTGLKYEYAKGSNIHASVQQTFRFLATDEWYSTFSGLNIDLKEQTGIQYEAGLKHNLHDATMLSMTPYWLDIKNEIYFDPYSVFFGTNKNYDETRRRGVEIGQKTDVLKLFNLKNPSRLEFFTNYTFQDARFNGGTYDKKLIPLVPKHNASAGINAGFIKEFYLSLTGRYIGSQFAINDTRNETPAMKPYYVVDSKLTYQKGPFEFFVGIKNLFDRKYSSYVVKSATSNLKDYYPSPERSFEVGVNYKF